MPNYLRINSAPLALRPETLGDASARVNEISAILRRLDEAKYGRPQSARHFAPTNADGGTRFVLAPSGAVWLTLDGSASVMTEYRFRDMMDMIAAMEVREITTEDGEHIETVRV